jgi:paraquat-inducible protein A
VDLKIVSLITLFSRRDKVAGILLLVALPLMIAGLSMPAISITRLFVFTDTYSIVGAVFAFWTGGNYVLFLFVFFFSLLFPAAKILIALWAWAVEDGDQAGENLKQICRLFAAVSKWSMLDVFIVALTVLAVEGSLLGAADVHLGIVLFAASIVLSTIAIQRLAARAKMPG